MWINCLCEESQRMIKSIFPQEIPDLGDVRLLRVEWNPDWIGISFDLYEIPEVVPKRWREIGFDKISISMEFIGGVQYRFMNLNLLKSEHFSLSIVMEDISGKKNIIGKNIDRERVFEFNVNNIYVCKVTPCFRGT